MEIQPAKEMKKLTLHIVLALFCCGFTKNGHAQSFGDFLLKFENAKKVDSIVGYLSTDSIIGYISIYPEYSDNLRPDDVEELENESDQELEKNKRLMVEKRQALLWLFEVKIGVPLDETSLSDDQKKELDEVAHNLIKYPDVHVYIHQTNLYKYRGLKYSWGKGTDSRDDKIFDCAIDVKKYLVLKGVPEERMKIAPIPL